MKTEELIELCKRELKWKKTQGYGDVQEELAYEEIIKRLEELEVLKEVAVKIAVFLDEVNNKERM